MSNIRPGAIVPKEMMEEIAEAYNLDFPENFESLSAMFSHQEWMMRKLASEYVFKLGPGVLPGLYEKLSDAEASEDTFYWGLKVFAKFADQESSRAQSHDYLVRLVSSGGFSGNKLIFLIGSVGALKVHDATSALIELLGHKNWIVRKESAAAIQAIGTAAVPELKEAFGSGNKDIRYWTVKILGQMLGTEAIDSFKKLLRSDKKDLRYYALTALGEIENSEAIDSVVASLGDESWLVRAQAAEILENRGRSAIKYIKAAFAEGNSDVRYWSIKILSRILKEEALDFLKKNLDTEDTELKFWVIDALSQMNFSRSAPVLLKLFDDSSWLVRKHVAAVFEKLGSQGASYLADALERESNDNIMYWAVQIIARADDQNFLKLLQILSKPGRPERIFIIQSLREARNVSALPALFELLGDPQWTLRREASITIMEYGAERVIPFIIERVDLASRDMEYWIQKIVSSSGDSGIASIKAALKKLDDAGQGDGAKEKLQKIYKMLGMIGSQKCVEIALKIFREKNESNKELLASALNETGSEPLVQHLLKALGEEDAAVCSWIARVLRNVSRNLRPLLFGVLDDKSPEKRVWVCKIFGEIRDQSFIAPLVMLLSDKDRNVRFEATRALGKFGSSDVFDSLIKQFLDEDEEGRICIIENFKTFIDDRMLDLLINRLNEASDTDAYWISKLIVETAREKIEIIEKKHSQTIESSRAKYWIKKIIDHIKGIKYL